MVRLQIASDQVQKGGLARAVRPDNANALAPGNVHIDRVSRLDHAKGFGQINGLQDRAELRHAPLLRHGG